MKQTYFFYARTDSTQEPIDRIEMEDIFEAIKYFAMKKQLSMDKFMSLYGVSKLNKDSND